MRAMAESRIGSVKNTEDDLNHFALSREPLVKLISISVREVILAQRIELFFPDTTSAPQ